MRAQQLAIIIGLATACGRAERQAAEARADSLQRVLQHQQDSLKGSRARMTADSLQRAQRQEDSLKAATTKATAAKHRADSLKMTWDQVFAK